uniref:Uncharacterized protein n=1 Tax=Romanomermis culicivorax TaxID=13658 RepID=A0A915KU11_ROMCU
MPLLELKDEIDKQCAISRFIVQKKMDNTNLRSEEIDEPVMRMIAVDDQPFSVVENAGFINLIKKQFIPEFSTREKSVYPDNATKTRQNKINYLRLIESRNHEITEIIGNAYFRSTSCESNSNSEDRSSALFISISIMNKNRQHDSVMKTSNRDHLAT